VPSATAGGIFIWQR